MGRNVLLLLSLFLLVSAVSAAAFGQVTKLTAEEKAYLIAIESWRPMIASDVEKQLVLARKATHGEMRESNRKSRKEAVRRLEEKLNNLQARGWNPLNLMRDPLAVGQVGSVGYVTIQQIIGPKDMLVKRQFAIGADGLRPHDALVWVTGIPTTGQVDGHQLDIDRIQDRLVVATTKSYENALGGSTTVFVLRPLIVDRNRLESALAQLAAAGPGKAQAVLEKICEAPSLSEERPARIARSMRQVKPSENVSHQMEQAGEDKLSRSSWLNESYKTALRQVGNKEWAEFDSKTGRLHLKYTETGRNDKYLELHCGERNQDLRVVMDAKRMELKKNGKWEWVASGHWDSPPRK